MSKNTNWRIAITSAMKIDLRDYADILEFDTEAAIWNNKFRLDMIIIRKTSDAPVENALVREFRPVNIFEIKGIGSSLSVPAFYKTLACAGLYASENSEKSPLPSGDVTVNFVSRKYPKKLAQFLRRKCGFRIEKRAPGVYHVDGTAFPVRVVVTGQLPAKEFLYLSCATDDLGDEDVERVDQLGRDVALRRSIDPNAYSDYIQQLYNAYSKKKGGVAMAVKKKVKSIYEMNLSELSRANEQQKREYAEMSAKFSRVNEQQKQDNARLSAELSLVNEQREQEYAELQDCKKLIVELQRELSALKHEMRQIGRHEYDEEN